MFKHKKRNPLVKYYDGKLELYDVSNTFAPAKKFIPDWYKKAPLRANTEITHYSYEGDPFKFELEKIDNRTQYAGTFKHCLPMLDAISMGYVVVSGEDIYFDEATQRFNETLEVQQWAHNPFELEGYPQPSWCHPKVYKWNSWIHIELPKGYSGLFMHPLHRLDLPFHTMSGVVDIDTHPLEVNPPFMMNKGFTGVIPKGTPMFQIIPIKREDWVSEEQEPRPVMNSGVIQELFTFNKYGFPFLGAYKKKIRKKKNYN